MMALSSSMVPEVSTTNTNAMMAMMMYKSTLHMVESPDTSSAAYPMPWFDAASVRSFTVASASASARTMSFSASVRSASVRSGLRNVNEYVNAGCCPPARRAAKPASDTSATPNVSVFTVKSELFWNSAWLSGVVMMPHTVKLRPLSVTASPTRTPLFCANTRSTATSSAASGTRPSAYAARSTSVRCA